MQDKQWMLSKPVAFMVFNRPVTTRRVFEAIRRAKPPKLFVVADGPRADRENENKICAEVRAITEKIDWECEVYRNYADENMGCKERMASGITWVFQHVDECIIIEDDILPDDSFFFFAETMLDKYRDDSRVMLVSGCSRLFGSPVNDISQWSEYSYTFSKISEVWGWATWKRVWDDMDYEMTFQNDEYAMKTFDSMNYNPYVKKSIKKMGEMRRKQWESTHKLTAWTYQFRMIRHLQSQLVIVPTKNLVSNIGVTGDATHATDSLQKMPKGIQQVFFIPTYDYEFPLKHPKYVMCDTEYDKLVWKVMGESRWAKFSRKVESLVRRIIFYDKGDGKSLKKSIKRYLGRS